VPRRCSLMGRTSFLAPLYKNPAAISFRTLALLFPSERRHSSLPLTRRQELRPAVARRRPRSSPANHGCLRPHSRPCTSGDSAASPSSLHQGRPRPRPPFVAKVVDARSSSFRLSPPRSSFAGSSSAASSSSTATPG
jgi:hypothetical protein